MYQCEKSDKKELVVKVFNTSESSVEESAINEASILKSLKHQHIVRMVDFFLDQLYSKAYLVLEYAGSESLFKFVQRQPEGKLSYSDAKVIMK